MLKAAGGGSIVNMSSAAGRHGYAFRTPYSAAKFGVIGFTQSLAKELGPANIRVNAILPGIVEGPRMEGVIRAPRRPARRLLRRDGGAATSRRSRCAAWSAHDDVAAMVAFLLSDAGANISGQSIGVDGNVETLVSMAKGRDHRHPVSSAAPGRSPSPAPATTSRCGTTTRTRRRRAIDFIARRARRPCGQRPARTAGRRTTCSPRSRSPPISPAALAGVDHVQENTPEDLEMKRAVFARARRRGAPEAVIASSTSAILPSAVHRGPRGPRTLPGRPPDQPALPHSGRRSGAGAVDRAGDRRAHAATC